MSLYRQEFTSHEDWVARASRVLTAHPLYQEGGEFHALCVDARGRVCSHGAGFDRARRDGAFPVTWAWPDQTDQLVVLLARVRDAAFREALAEPPRPAQAFRTRVADLVAAVRYKPGWSIRAGEDGERVYLQVCVSEAAEASLDAHGSGARTAWRGGKRYLSPHMCDQELVGAAFDALKAAELHETHEWFRYRGAAIYSPHLRPDRLVEVARRRENFEFRTNAMSLEEPR